jgi:hypothetical protein
VPREPGGASCPAENVENTPFAADEQTEIAKQLGEITEYVKKTYELSEDQTHALEAARDDLTEAAGRLGGAMRHLRMRLDGRQRFTLADPRQISSLDRGPSSAVMAIWRDHAMYREMRRIVLESLQRYFVINVADLPQISMSLSDEPILVR